LSSSLDLVVVLVAVVVDCFLGCKWSYK